MKKINKKKVFIILILMLFTLTLFAGFGNEVRAEINPDTDPAAKGFAAVYENLINNITNLISVNSAFSTLSRLIGLLAMMIYLGIAMAFSGVTGSIFPAPDSIIFNRLAILDVNFINPNPYSFFTKYLHGLIMQLYNSFHAIALTAFVLCAMFVGLKIVLSSLASEKAAAKNALKHWLVGIVVLFLMRLIIAGIFELNELLVWNISQLVEKEVMFKIDFATALDGILPTFGFSLGAFLRSALSIKAETEVPGYGGMLMMYAWNACIRGDIFSAILLFVLLGQTITLFIAYTKRLTYTIILGTVAPLVIVLDTINKVLKGSSNILNNWFREFISTVFMQTFHAMLMAVTLLILSTVSADDSTQTNMMFSGIMAIALTSGMIKFEKTYKQIFGMQDGMVGGLQGQAAKLLVGLNAAKAGVKAVADNGAKLKNATKQRTEAKSRRAELIRERGRQNAYGALDNLSLAAQLQNDPIQKQKYMDKANEMFASASRDGYKIPDEMVKRFEAIANSLKGVAPVMAAASNNINFKAPVGTNDRYSDIINYGSRSSTTFGGNTSNVYNSNVTRGGGVAPSYTASTSDKSLLETNKNIEKEITRLRKQLSSMDKSGSVSKMDRQIAKATKDFKNANAEVVSAGLATAMGPINLAAGIGMGLGFGDSMTDAMKGGYVTAALDSAAEHAGRTIGRAVNAQFDSHSKTDDTY